MWLRQGGPGSRKTYLGKAGLKTSELFLNSLAHSSDNLAAHMQRQDSKRREARAAAELSSHFPESHLGSSRSASSRLSLRPALPFPWPPLPPPCTCQGEGRALVHGFTSFRSGLLLSWFRYRGEQGAKAESACAKKSLALLVNQVQRPEGACPSIPSGTRP